MPAVGGGPDQRAVGAAGADLRLGRREDAGLDVAPLGVQPVEPLGEGRGLVRVVGREQPRPEVGGADPAAGVDPRPEREAERPGARRAADAGDGGERREAGAGAARHHRQPLAHQRAVEPDERRHVGDRGQRDEVEHGRAGRGRSPRAGAAAG